MYRLDSIALSSALIKVSHIINLSCLDKLVYSGMSLHIVTGPNKSKSPVGVELETIGAGVGVRSLTRRGVGVACIGNANGVAVGTAGMVSTGSSTPQASKTSNRTNSEYG